MSASHFQEELSGLNETYQSALACDVESLKDAIAGASESSVIGVGSGGSYTVASLLCGLHEAYTGRVSRSSTPLEIICNPNLASSSPVFLISAEGKNPDITEALQRARRHSARTVHVLTNRSESPLISNTSQLLNVRTHVFELSRKDGYLATNSLLLDAMLVARAYGELDGEKNQLPTSIDLLEIDGRSAALWVDGAAEFVKSAVSCGAVVVVFSPQLKAIAADLESKLAEAALLHCQFADLRSFAHGRHLWLAERPGDIAVLAITEPSLHGLWLEMKKLFPSNTATHEMALSGASPRDLIAGLTAQMYFVGAVAKRLGRDPGRPKVPQFGRDLYYVDLPKVIPGPEESEADIDGAKYDVLGARWPSSRTRLDMVRARKSYADAMTKRRFRAIVFDYDGTLVGSQRNHSPPSERILYHIRRLVEGGVVVGVASGRGGSVQEALAQSLSDSELEKIQLGLYNGGWIGDARTPPQDKKVTSEFLSHVTRIVRKLEPLGVPIEGIRTTHPYQVSIRFRDGLPTDQMWFVVADSLRQAGLDIGTMVRSKHSVDVLAQGVTKSRLIAHVIEKFKVDPYDVVTVGDQGAWPGNDSTLLEHRYSLSVDMPSRRIDRGWKFAPSHKRDVDATTWYLDRIEIATGGSFKFLLEDSAQG